MAIFAHAEKNKIQNRLAGFIDGAIWEISVEAAFAAASGESSPWMR